MPKTTHSPVKLLSDLGIDVMNLSSQEDYKSALIEGLAKLQVTGETGSERFKILKDEVLRVKREKLKAEDPTYTTKEERPPIVKKTKITGADIKRTGAVGSAEKVAADTTGASAIQKWKPLAKSRQVVEDVTPTDSEEEKAGALAKPTESGALAKPTESLIGPLKTIDSSVNAIIETLKSSNKADAQAQSDARKEAEKDKRKKGESKLEAITGPLGKVADKVLAPVRSIFDKIFGFLQTILLGNVAMKLWNWFADPANGEKISSVFKFLGDWWPVLVGSMLAFAPMLFGPAGFIIGVVALVAWGIPKIISVIDWVKGLFGAGVQKEVDTLTKGSEDASIKLGEDIDNDLTKDTDTFLSKNTGEEPEESEKTEKPSTGEVGDSDPNAGQKLDKLRGEGDAVIPKDVDKEPMDTFNKGGIVPGSGPNRDTVPAMLTPGEFVMSRGAVQKYGSDTLAGMNAAAGGTNRPTMGGYKSGGIVNNISQNSVQNVKGVQNVGGPRIHYSGGGKVMNLPGLGGGGGGTNSLTEQAKVYTKKDQGWFGRVRGGLDMITGNRWDFDRQDIVKNIKADANRTGLENYASNPQWEAIKGTNLERIGPPSTPTTQVIVDRGIASQLQAVANSAPDMELPYFNASKMRSLSKIRTLGITV